MQCDFELCEEHEQKLSIKKELLAAKKKYKARQYQSPTKKVIELEKDYEKLIYWMIKTMGALNKVSISPREIRAYTIHEVFSLKEQLEQDIAAHNAKSNGQH